MSKYIPKFNNVHVAIFLCMVFVIACISYLNATKSSLGHEKKDRLYFSLTDFSFPIDGGISIGDYSDICFKDVSHDFMRIQYNQSTKNYSYAITPPQEGKYVYYKVNDVNPNLYEFTSATELIFNKKNYSYEAIISLLQGFDNEYYMLSDVIAVLDSTWLSSDTYKKIAKGEKFVGSFIYKENTRGKLEFWKMPVYKYRICILDEFTEIRENENECLWNYSHPNTAIVNDALNNGESIKVQFFKMTSWTTEKQNEEYLNDGVRNYYAKPVQLFTEWGAGHIKVSCKDSEKNIHTVTFPKALTTTFFVDGIQDKIEQSEAGVYLKQMLNTYPIATDFYVPPFSIALSEYICELKVRDDSVALVFQNTDKRDSINVANCIRITPELPQAKQTLAKGSITYRSRILNSAFYLSNYWMLAALYILLCLILCYVLPEGEEIHHDRRGIRYYVIMLFTMFWFYLNQKLYIAEKLSFTYPYFEKIYPITYLTTIFSLSALFLLIILTNRSYIGESKCWNVVVKNKIRYVDFNGISMWVTCAIILFFSGYAVYKMWEFIQPIWNGYIFIEQTKIWNIFEWLDNSLLNDNHFTVPLILGVGLVVLLFLFIILFSKSKLARCILYIISKLVQCVLWCEKNLKIWYINNLIPWKNSTNRFLRCAYWIFIIVFIIVLVVSLVMLMVSIGLLLKLLGNFGTTIAVLLLICVLSRFLKWTINWTWKPEWLRYLLIFPISACFLCIGFFADNGFFTNIVGILFVCFLVIYVVSDSIVAEREKKIPKFGLTLLVGIAICISIFFVVVYNANPAEVDYDRRSRRINIVLAEEQVREAGYSYTESDMQWMDLMHYYVEKAFSPNTDNTDIYDADNGFHSLIATGQSPVVLNDVSMPAAYFGPLKLRGFISFIWGLFVIGVLIVWFNFFVSHKKSNGEIVIDDFDTYRIGRIIAGCLWIGVSIYIFVSYTLLIPFTGRLIPGFGVDAVGEALEILVLFTFMCKLSPSSKK